MKKVKEGWLVTKVAASAVHACRYVLAKMQGSGWCIAYIENGGGNGVASGVENLNIRLSDEWASCETVGSTQIATGVSAFHDNEC